jgi:hypothetical protein
MALRSCLGAGCSTREARPDRRGGWRTVSIIICGTGGVDGMKSVLLLSTALKWSKICARSVTLSAARAEARALYASCFLLRIMFALSHERRNRSAAPACTAFPWQRYRRKKDKDAARRHGPPGQQQSPCTSPPPAQHAAAMRPSNAAALERGCRGPGAGPRARARVLKFG